MHSSHDPVYCYKAGMVTFEQAKAFRAEGDLEGAKRALDKASSAFTHAAAQGESKLHELVPPPPAPLSKPKSAQPENERERE